MEQEHSKEKSAFFAVVRIGSTPPPPHHTWSDALPALQRYCTENAKQIFPEMKLRSLVPNSYIHLSVSHLNIPKIALPILRPIVGIYKSLKGT
jgi:hypothetical protein